MEKLLLARSKDNGSRALQLMLRAFEEGEDAGVAPEMMAYAALFTALTDLVGHYGEDAVIKLTTRLTRRVREGEFSGRASGGGAASVAQ